MPLKNHQPSINDSVTTAQSDVYTSFHVPSKYAQILRNRKPPKHSLSHYFSTLLVTAVVILISATGLLFIWSNTSDGAWVSLRVIPDIGVTSTQTSNPVFNKINALISMFSNTNINLFNIINNNSSSNYSSNPLIQSLLNSDDINDLLSSSDSPFSKNGDNVYHFSLYSSVTDFYDSKAYMLAIIIALFSGIWPYIKLLLLMVCWLQPMPQKRREYMLIMLDQLGKFSFVDLFVCLFMLVAFYVQIHESISTIGGISITVTVEPDVGINTFVIGTVISMLFSHFFLYLDAQYAKPHLKRFEREQKLYQSKYNNDNAKVQELNNNEHIIVNKNSKTTDISDLTSDNPPPTSYTQFTQSPNDPRNIQRNMINEPFVQSGTSSIPLNNDEDERKYAINFNNNLKNNPLLSPPLTPIKKPINRINGINGVSPMPPQAMNDEIESPINFERNILIESSQQYNNNMSDDAKLLQNDQMNKKLYLVESQHEWNYNWKPFALRFLPQSWFGIIIRSIILLSMIGSLWLTYLSLNLAPVRYDMEGIVGIAISDPIRAFTPFQIFEEVPNRTDEHFAAPFLAVSFFATVIFFPILTIFLLILLWFLPTTHKFCIYISHAAEISCAWSALDVFLLASFAASLELQRVSQWILSQQFPINGTPICADGGLIQTISGLKCMVVIGNLTYGAAIMLAGVLSFWIAFGYSMYQIHLAKKRI